MTKEEIEKLMLKDANPDEVRSYISESGVKVYISGQPNIKKLAKFLVEKYYK